MGYYAIEDLKKQMNLQFLLLKQQFKDFKKKHNPCYNYNTLSNPFRALTYSNSSYFNTRQFQIENGDDVTCDNIALAGVKTDPQWKGAGYYRFEGPFTRMATSGEVNKNFMCGTTHPGYISDPSAHDIKEGETRESVEVCFYVSAFCQQRTTISMTKCEGGFYIYKLPDTPLCSYGYCGAN